MDAIRRGRAHGRMLMACIGLVLLAILLARGVATSRAQGQGALPVGESCIEVLHLTPHFDGEAPDPDYGGIPVNVAGINGSTYTVEYRTIDPENLANISSWQTPMESPIYASYMYDYSTEFISSAVAVQWRVTAVGHEGIKITTSETVISAMPPDSNYRATTTAPLVPSCSTAKLPLIVVPYELP